MAKQKPPKQKREAETQIGEAESRVVRPRRPTYELRPNCGLRPSAALRRWSCPARRPFEFPSFVRWEWARARVGIRERAEQYTVYLEEPDTLSARVVLTSGPYTQTLGRRTAKYKVSPSCKL